MFIKQCGLGAKKIDIFYYKPSLGATKSRCVFDIVMCGENLHQIYTISGLIVLISLYTDKVIRPIKLNS